MNKIDKWFLVPQPIVFVEREFYRAKRNAMLFKKLFVWFNVLSMISTFAILTLSTLVVSKTIFNGVPDWYFYATTVVSAVVTLLTSIINFFYVKEKAAYYKEYFRYIQAEIIKYQSNTGTYKNAKNKDLEIFHRVNLKLGNKAAREVENERNI